MKNILVPVGNTEHGINNLHYAVNFAHVSGARVFLMNLYQEYSKVGSMVKVNEMIVAEQEAQLHEVLKRVDTKGVKVTAKTIKGDPFEGIARISKQLNIDLIILSPQSIEIKDEIYLGSVTGKLVKQTETPMLIVPGEYLYRKVDRILLALKNGHFENKTILDPLKGIMDLFKAKLDVLHVITPDGTGGSKDLDEDLLKLKHTLTVTKNATTYQGVLEHFQSHKPDMLCVIRRKRGFFQKLWEKNVIYKREFYTSIPLLILSGRY